MLFRQFPTRRTAFARCTALLLAIQASTAIAAAQQDQGPLLGIPMAFSVDGTGPAPGSGSAAPNTLYTKKGGHFGSQAEASEPAAPPSSMLFPPDFRFESILREFSSVDMNGNRVFPQIDAFSIGLDVVPVVESNGERVISFAGRWGALQFSVLQDSQFRDLATAIRREKLNGADGAGADVFNYVLESSTDISARFTGETERVLDGAETGFASNPGARNNITSMDVHVPWFDLDDRLVDLIERPVIAYFSVTNGTRQNLPGGTAGGRSGATIYRAQWTIQFVPRMGLVGRWRALDPLFTFGDLGFPTETGAEIDAFAFDSSSRNALFSLSRATTPTGWSQLMLVDVPPPPSAVSGSALLGTPPLVPVVAKEFTDSGNKVLASIEEDGNGGTGGAIRSGVQGDITGVCENDPTRLQPGVPTTTPGFIGRLAWGTPRVWGFPVVDGIETVDDLDLSVFRNCQPDGDPAISFHATSPTPLGTVFGLVSVSLAPGGFMDGDMFGLLGPNSFVPFPIASDPFRLSSEIPLTSSPMLQDLTLFLALVHFPGGAVIHHSTVTLIDT